MRTIYSAVLSLGRWFFARTGIPVPRFGRRLQLTLRSRLANKGESDLRAEIDALSRVVDRLDAADYLARFEQPPE